MILRGWGIRTTSGYFGLPPFFEFEIVCSKVGWISTPNPPLPATKQPKWRNDIGIWRWDPRIASSNTPRALRTSPFNNSLTTHQILRHIPASQSPFFFNRGVCFVDDEKSVIFYVVFLGGGMLYITLFAGLNDGDIHLFLVMCVLGHEHFLPSPRPSGGICSTKICWEHIAKQKLGMHLPQILQKY